MTLHAVRRIALASSLAAASLALGTAPGHATKPAKLPRPGVSAPVAVPQGPNWTPATRLQFYSQDQGSQIMPLDLVRGAPAAERPAVHRPTASSRYGYLPNPASPTPGLPVGFTVNGSGDRTMVGMTCAACHTRQITSGGIQYRIDGGPAIVDFQSFLADLDTAVGTVREQRRGVRGLRRRGARPVAPAGPAGGAAERRRRPGTCASTPWSRRPCPTRPGASAASTPCR